MRRPIQNFPNQLQLYILSFVTVFIQLQSVECHSHAPIGYTAIYILVIVELTVAFAIGIVCIIFSVNLLRAVSDQDSSLSMGELPRSRPTSVARSWSKSLLAGSTGALNKLSPDYTAEIRQVTRSDLTASQPFVDGGDTSNYQSARAQCLSFDESEYDTESVDPRQGGLYGIVQSFADYIRIW